MNADTEESLVEKLQKIERLFARSATPGERLAAQSARERIRQRLDQLEKSERVEEYRFSLSDDWSKSLFIALLRRYGLKPYRYHRQRRTTVMVRVTASFVDEVLWPEFQEIDTTLRAHLDSITTRIIREAIHSDDSDVEERGGDASAPGSKQSVLSVE